MPKTYHVSWSITVDDVETPREAVNWVVGKMLGETLCGWPPTMTCSRWSTPRPARRPRSTWRTSWRMPDLTKDQIAKLIEACQKVSAMAP